MNARLVFAALAATLVVFQSIPVRATCVIAPDGKSINVVPDNGSSDGRHGCRPGDPELCDTVCHGPARAGRR